MDFDREDQDLDIVTGNIPEDYYHPNLFQYTDVRYCDARWIRLEHLFSVKNENCMIQLGKNKLTVVDINKLLAFWANSENDLFDRIQIERDEQFIITDEVLFHGLVVLQSKREKSCNILLAVNSPANRKRQILSIFWGLTHFFIHTWPIDKRIFFDDEPYAREYELLNMLQRRRALEEKMRTVKENNQIIVEIQEEIDEIMNELRRRRMRFGNGIPVMT
ncbi:hypothetical protein CRE_19519 [Caenorhabditis remanei]|uniref:F-box associated domain-containing protein n=1 Tax=Caenorhabditis remanei TaxID=31234 RepID=E3NHZ4_CAERE|nr:hypothetical protein CRE_19519 [Caenorhabditis remanei]